MILMFVILLVLILLRKNCRKWWVLFINIVVNFILWLIFLCIWMVMFVGSVLWIWWCSWVLMCWFLLILLCWSMLLSVICILSVMYWCRFWWLMKRWLIFIIVILMLFVWCCCVCCWFIRWNNWYGLYLYYWKFLFLAVCVLCWKVVVICCCIWWVSCLIL